MSVPAPILPDYRGPNLAGLIPALTEPPGRRPAWLPVPAQEPSQTVLLVLDGLGWLQLQERLPLAPNLAAMESTRITSVVPTTTATALTSITVGVPPAVHGIVGYKVVVDGPGSREVMNVLRWRTPSGDARPFVEPETFQPMTPFGGRAIPVVSKYEFDGTGFSVAHQRGAQVAGWVQASSLVVEVRRLVAAGTPLVYAYYEGIDKIAHYKGFGDHYDAELTAADRIVGDLLDTLPADAALVVTADHGQVEVGPNAQVLDPRLMDHVSMVSGEARFRWLHARDGADADSLRRLAGVALDLYGGSAWVVTIDEIERDGWFGGPLTPSVRSRLGDVAVVPFEPLALLAPAESGDPVLACRHGSLTPDEMYVPLLAQAGRLGK